MNISLLEIQNRASVFASKMLLKQIESEEKKLTVDDIRVLRTSEIFTSDYGQQFVNWLILGAIEEYHTQLHNVLQSKGIDIGEMEP